jgi:hypothetical protein
MAYSVVDARQWPVELFTLECRMVLARVWQLSYCMPNGGKRKEVCRPQFGAATYKRNASTVHGSLHVERRPAFEEVKCRGNISTC